MYELFLKNMVGGLHTVYTKLKRLEVTPLICNVEQAWWYGAKLCIPQQHTSRSVLCVAAGQFNLELTDVNSSKIPISKSCSRIARIPGKNSSSSTQFSLTIFRYLLPPYKFRHLIPNLLEYYPLPPTSLIKSLSYLQEREREREGESSILALRFLRHYLPICVDIRLVNWLIVRLLRATR